METADRLSRQSHVAFGREIAYGRRVRMLGGLSPRSALLDAGIGVVALALRVAYALEQAAPEHRVQVPPLATRV